ncbi:MAG: MFS transporter [Candidatus Hydrogenedentes bacterium]|nr:MFS transporter [Candidatus Hydrogenedentota bacterium]
MHAMGLLKQRRFAPLFWVQALGAFNDNVFKNALVILVTFKSMGLAGLDGSQTVALCGGLFILPFFLFSGLAGQMADHWPKSKLIPWIKFGEIIIMMLATVGLFTEHLALLLFVLFLMGAQSSFFGPIKFGILPELLDESDLVGGNALVEMATFLAILLGTLTGGIFIAMDGGAWWVSATVLTIALVGWLVTFRLAPTQATNPGRAINWNPASSTWSILQQSMKERSIFLPILGISWFWFLGASLLALFPAFSSDVLAGNEHLVTFFLALFSIGIGMGSMLCERLSKGKLELGLVPIGSIGMTIFTLDLFLAGTPSIDGAFTLKAFLSEWAGLRISLDILLLSVFGGCFIVPLMTMIQQRSDPARRASVIAGSNIVNAFFMVLSAVFLIVLQKAGLSIPGIFAVLAVMNAAIAIYIYTLIPEFMYRLLCFLLANVLYRLRIEGQERIPEEGPVVLASNHVTFVDWMLIAGACRRPVRFVMHYSFMKIPVARWIFKGAGVIPIASQKESLTTLKAAFDTISEALENGEVVCIFPEGQITRDGKFNEFRAGIERIVQRNPAPVVPIALTGLWGSYFSRERGKAMKGNPLRWLWARVDLQVGEAIPSEDVTAEGVKEQVTELHGGDKAPADNKEDAREKEKEKETEKEPTT